MILLQRAIIFLPDSFISFPFTITIGQLTRQRPRISFRCFFLTKKKRVRFKRKDGFCRVYFSPTSLPFSRDREREKQKRPFESLFRERSRINGQLTRLDAVHLVLMSRDTVAATSQDKEARDPRIRIPFVARFGRRPRSAISPRLWRHEYDDHATVKCSRTQNRHLPPPPRDNDRAPAPLEKNRGQEQWARKYVAKIRVEGGPWNNVFRLATISVNLGRGIWKWNLEGRRRSEGGFPEFVREKKRGSRLYERLKRCTGTRSCVSFLNERSLVSRWNFFLLSFSRDETPRGRYYTSWRKNSDILNATFLKINTIV